MALEMPGFTYDPPAADALARLLRPQLEQVLSDEGQVTTVLAALFLSAAAVVHRSQLRRQPAAVAAAGWRLIVEAVTADRVPW